MGALTREHVHVRVLGGIGDQPDKIRGAYDNPPSIAVSPYELFPVRLGNSLV